MITMTELEILNIVEEHLLKQNRHALNSKGACSYRALDGTKCAVGCLISDEEYSPKMEGGTVTILIAQNLLPERLLPYAVLLMELQSIHDNYPVDTWKELLDKIRASLLDQRGD